MHASVSPLAAAPRVFISYSWDSEEHKKWVVSLAATLVGKGVDVILDVWHLHYGQDKNFFMEKAVAESNYVLLICTSAYAAKANERVRGVGYEAMVITSEIAEDIAADKFIPVLRADDWKDELPRWIKNKLGPDLRGEPCSQQALDDLVRALHRAHQQPPPLGAPPTFSSEPAKGLDFSASSASPTSPPFELPPAAEAFFGRKAQLAQLTDRLRARQNTAVVGHAGFGKTALAAAAVRAVVGEPPKTLAVSPYPDGVLFLDLYRLQGMADRAWDEIARKLTGQPPVGTEPSFARASAACLGKRCLLIVEGAEEATGQDGRTSVRDLTSVLTGENRWLLLTRSKDHLDPGKMVELPDTLDPDDAAQLLDHHAEGRVTGQARTELLRLLDGHPLALTWAAKRLSIGDDGQEAYVREWKAARLPGLADVENAEHTLEWLYRRSKRGLPAQAQQALEAAGLLGLAAVPVSAVAAALSITEDEARESMRLLTRRALLRLTRDGHWQFTHVLGYRFARQETGSDAGLRMRLGGWLDARLAQALAPGAAPAELPVLTLLEHLGPLLRADDDVSLWQPLANHALYNFSDRLQELGRLGQARQALDSVDAWFSRLSSKQVDDPFWLRERSSLGTLRGDILIVQGDLDAALRSYSDALQIDQRLAQADPSSAQAQRDLRRQLRKSRRHPQGAGRPRRRFPLLHRLAPDQTGACTG